MAAAALIAPGVASASKSQLSLIQDDRELLGSSGQDPAASMAEIANLGVDVVRTNIIYYKIYRTPSDRTRPAGFDAADPNSPFYDWSNMDRLVRLANANGLRILGTITGPGPHFTTRNPGGCDGVPCTKNPKPADFGKFAAAVAKRYRGQIDYYSIWNEPNLENWLSPQQKRPGLRKVQTEAVIYRKLFIAAYNSIAKFDRGRRNKVMFGEVAAISEPLPLLYAALCLDIKGNKFRGRQAKRHGCAGKVKKLNIGGFAVHPYNSGAYGTPRSKTRSKFALPMAYMPRLHRLIDRAKKLGRITRRAPILSTEFGFQSRPPERGPAARFAPSLAEQARFINETDRLFYADRRVSMVGQYELTDPPELDVFNTGLRFAEVDGRGAKPSYDAYRVPLVVSRLSSRRVEVYGQVRPGGSASVQIQAARGKGAFKRVKSVRTSGRGMFKVKVSRAGATRLRWRLVSARGGSLLTSRVAKAGKPLRYYKN
ncbi:MAG: hypothetical protein M3356_04275 [Actinomycetota bacterium]|nr:hypothetical protein [Actinomycetota bacterium]